MSCPHGVRKSGNQESVHSVHSVSVTFGSVAGNPEFGQEFPVLPRPSCRAVRQSLCRCRLEILWIFFLARGPRVVAAIPCILFAPDSLTGLHCAQAKFHDNYWRAAYSSMICTITAAAAWSFLKLALGFYGRHMGWHEYRECCISTYEFYQGVEEQQMAAILYESFFSGFWFVMLAGFSLDHNLLAYVLREVVPLSARVRFSENGKVLHLWHSDGGLNTGAFGNFLGWCTAIGVAPIAASPWVLWANDYAQVRGSGDQLSWLIVVIAIALRLRVNQASTLIFLSIVSSWVGIFVNFGIKARRGEESIFFDGSESCRLSFPTSLCRTPRSPPPSLPSVLRSLAPSLRAATGASAPLGCPGAGFRIESLPVAHLYVDVLPPALRLCGEHLTPCVHAPSMWVTS